MPLGPQGNEFTKSDANMLPSAWDNGDYEYNARTREAGSYASGIDDDEGGFLTTPFPNHVGRFIVGVDDEYWDGTDDAIYNSFLEDAYEGSSNPNIQFWNTSDGNNRWDDSNFIDPNEAVDAHHNTLKRPLVNLSDGLSFFNNWLLNNTVSYDVVHDVLGEETIFFYGGEYRVPYGNGDDSGEPYRTGLAIPAAGAQQYETTSRIIDGTTRDRISSIHYLEAEPIGSFYNHMVFTNTGAQTAYSTIENWKDSIGVNSFGPTQMVHMVTGSQMGEGNTPSDSTFGFGCNFDSGWTGNRDNTYEWGNRNKYSWTDAMRWGQNSYVKYSSNAQSSNSATLAFAPASMRKAGYSGQQYIGYTRQHGVNESSNVLIPSNISGSDGQMSAEYQIVSSTREYCFSAGIGVFEIDLANATSSETHWFKNVAKMPWYKNPDIAQAVFESLDFGNSGTASADAYVQACTFPDDCEIVVEAEIKLSRYFNSSLGILGTSDYAYSGSPSTSTYWPEEGNTPIPVCCAIYPLWDDDYIVEGADHDDAVVESHTRTPYDWIVLNHAGADSISDEWNKYQFNMSKTEMQDSGGIGMFDRLMAYLMNGGNNSYGALWQTPNNDFEEWQHGTEWYSQHPHAQQVSETGKIQIVFYVPLLNNCQGHDAKGDGGYQRNDDSQMPIYDSDINTIPDLPSSSTEMQHLGTAYINNVKLYIRSKGNRQGGQ